MSAKTMIIYHKDCADGQCAAWVVRSYLLGALGETTKEVTERGVTRVTSRLASGEQILLWPAAYGDDIPSAEDLRAVSQVLIVDFSYSPEQLARLCDLAPSVVVLDHHQSAVERLAGFSRENCVLDLDICRSGAMLAWEQITPVIAPSIVLYVQDRDLWRWWLPYSREVSAWVRSNILPDDDPSWPSAWDTMHSVLGRGDLTGLPKGIVVQEGAAILRAEQQILQREARRAVRVVLRVSSETLLAVPGGSYWSELADAARSRLTGGEEKTMTVCVWRMQADGSGYSLSFRGPQARQLAESLGGGGHDQAAGARVDGPEFPFVLV